MFPFLYLEIEKKIFANIQYTGWHFGFHLVPVSDITCRVGCAKFEVGKVEVLGEGILDNTLAASVPSLVIYWVLSMPG